MENSKDISPTHCLNCGTAVHDNYCQHCSQRVRDNTDRSLTQLLGEFLGNVFFIDNRFMISVWYLFRYPGRMTVEFLEGKRKKFISPVTLFLFVNLIYFFLTTLTDYSIVLSDQLEDQVYSGEWVVDMVRSKMISKDLDFQSYSAVYQKTSDTISKSVMIINVPLIALFVYLMAFKKRRYYYDSLLFAFHFFALFLMIMTAAGWLDELITAIAGHEDSILSNVLFSVFLYGLPILYGGLSIKRFLNLRWYWAIPAGVGVIAAVLAANMVYRLIIFCLTIWFT